jgi:hypothetical protein
VRDTHRGEPHACAGEERHHASFCAVRQWIVPWYRWPLLELDFSQRGAPTATERSAMDQGSERAVSWFVERVRTGAVSWFVERVRTGAGEGGAPVGLRTPRVSRAREWRGVTVQGWWADCTMNQRRQQPHPTQTQCHCDCHITWRMTRTAGGEVGRFVVEKNQTPKKTSGGDSACECSSSCMGRARRHETDCVGGCSVAERETYGWLSPLTCAIFQVWWAASDRAWWGGSWGGSVACVAWL